MPEPSLDRPGIVSLVGEGIAAGMAKHVRTGFQLKAEPFAGRPLDHPCKARSRERRARSLTKYEGRRLGARAV